MLLFVRTVLVLTHLLFFALAMATVLREDWRFIRNRMPSRKRLRLVGQRMSWWFSGLLLSGAALVWIDTGFNLGQILDNPKLLAKLAVVAVLALNGCLLHLWGLEALGRPHCRAAWAASGLALLGAVSTCSWIMAAWLGIGRSLTSTLGFQGFMAVYAAALCAAAAVSLLWMRPLLMRRLKKPVREFDTAPLALEDGAEDSVQGSQQRAGSSAA